MAETGGADGAGLFGLITQGGWVLYLLVAVSIVALTIIIAKGIQFAVARIGAQGFTNGAIALWRENRPDEALAAVSESPAPLARVMTAAMTLIRDGRLGEDKAREEVTRIAGAQIDRLRSGLPTLALIAALSPLLGLLGTVIGMIDAFQALEAAGNRVNPAILSGGIWVALLTTAAGLIVAIPALAAHHWLDGRVERCARAMEDAVTRLFTLSPTARAQPGASQAAARPAE